ncbi:hypothetical protein [Aestuariivita boseongensis]|uniref:hypothetical protein n=1 Tax=Aestuariivita boseongensis TaxID=1470562 RepID=UPI0006806298|nr:hypothetical protein [Aestuariivita boseongensis]
MLIWFVSVGLGFAQQISIPAQVVNVGQDFPIQYDIPETQPQRSYKLAIIPEGARTIPNGYSLYSPGPGVWRARAPLEPGDYRAVIALQDGDTPFQTIPFKVVFQPIPGAIRVSRTEVLSGESVSVNVSVPKNRHYPDLWVGLFELGRNMEEGGASVGDERRKYNRVGTDGRVGDLVMPRPAGEYELRLFDRSDGPYVLDRVRITVKLPPQPGVISLNKDTFEVGETVRVTVSSEASLNFSPWVGVFWPGDAEQKRPEVMREWDWLDKEARTWEFRAPQWEGTYEVRLFEENRFDHRYETDRIVFTVVASPQPNAIRLEKRTFAPGEDVRVPVRYDTSRGQYSSWVGLFSIPRDQGEGNAPQTVHRIDWDWVKNGEAATLRAPVWPGEYEIRLYDRDGRRYLLDRQTIKVVVEPVPEALELSSRSLDLGQPFTVTARLPEGRAYPSPVVRVFRKDTDTAEGGAGITPEVVQWNWVRGADPVGFNGITRHGTYIVRLYDRGDYGFLLDEEEFEVAPRMPENAVSTNKTVYRTGEKIAITVALPANRVTSNTMVGLFVEPENREGHASAQRHRIDYAWIRPDQTRYELAAPSIVGSYHVLVLDRDNYGYELGRVAVQVISDGVDVMRISKRSFAPGEVIRIQTRIPPDRRLYSPQVRLMRSSFQMEGGVIGVEVPVRSRAVSASEGETFELTAPNAPGKYELRYYDRNAPWFILDIEEFMVQGDPGASAPREYVRLTPMPGEGRVTPAALPRPATPGPVNAGEGGDTPTSGDEAEAPNAPSEGADDTGATPSENADAEGDTSGAPAAEDAATPPRLIVEALTPAGMQPVTEIRPGDSFRVRVEYAKAPDSAPPSVSVSAAGGAAMELALRPSDQAGRFVTDVARIPLATGE